MLGSLPSNMDAHPSTVRPVETILYVLIGEKKGIFRIFALFSPKNGCNLALSQKIKNLVDKSLKLIYF